MDVLITSVSRKVSLIRSFQKALSDTVGGQVIGIDASPYAAALYVADIYYLAPQGQGTEFLDFVQDICRKHNVRIIIPTRDEELPFFAEHKEIFTALGVTVMVPSLQTVEICQDKKKFVYFCEAHNFAVPKTFNINDKSSMKFPVFVRDQFGKGSRWAFRIDDDQELGFIVTRLKSPLIQEYINADEYTVDIFADFTGKIMSVVPRLRLRIFGGESFVGKVCHHPEVIDETSRLAQALSLVGHNTIQCFWHQDKVKFIEVNPRYGGGAALGFAAGANTPKYIVQLVAGQQVRPSVDDIKEGFVMLRFTDDLFGIEQESGLKFETQD